MKNWHATSYSTQPRSRRYGHGVTRSRRKPPRRRCRPTLSLGRLDRPLALLLSSLFSCSETLLSRFLVAFPLVRDLLLCAKHLFVAAKLFGMPPITDPRGIACCASSGAGSVCEAAARCCGKLSSRAKPPMQLQLQAL